MGSRSVLFRFRDESASGYVGAFIEDIRDEPDGSLVVRLLFWDDAVAIWASPGAQFEIWYGKPVGEGQILDQWTDSIDEGTLT